MFKRIVFGFVPTNGFRQGMATKHFVPLKPRTPARFFHPTMRIKEEKSEQLRAAQQAKIEEKGSRQLEVALRAKIKKMMEGVRGVHSTERVPIAYAIDKIKLDKRRQRPRDWYWRHLKLYSSEDLQIEKVRGRYTCSQERVDAMDFTLWYSAFDGKWGAIDWSPVL